jgi:hypothetical protein
MKLVKNGNGIIVPDDSEPLLELVVKRTGVQLKSPLPPNEVCKLLNNIATDVMFTTIQSAELPRIQSPTPPTM